MIEFNINDYIYVQLTDVGRETINEYYEMPSMLINDKFEFEIKEDSEGWSKWQMWDLMKIIGHKFENGMNPPIFTTIRLANVKIPPVEG